MISVYHNSDKPIAQFRSQSAADQFIARMGRNGFGGMTTKAEAATRRSGNEWIADGYTGQFAKHA